MEVVATNFSLSAAIREDFKWASTFYKLYISNLFYVEIDNNKFIISQEQIDILDLMLENGYDGWGFGLTEYCPKYSDLCRTIHMHKDGVNLKLTPEGKVILVKLKMKTYDVAQLKLKFRKK